LAIEPFLLCVVAIGQCRGCRVDGDGVRRFNFLPGHAQAARREADEIKPQIARVGHDDASRCRVFPTVAPPAGLLNMLILYTWFNPRQDDSARFSSLEYRNL
jgi:hypothetical protein